MEWGGWEDWETFRDHYLAEFSPEALRRERGKVSWLGGREEPDSAEGYSAVDPRVGIGRTLLQNYQGPLSATRRVDGLYNNPATNTPIHPGFGDDSPVAAARSNRIGL
jgi:hypothetical protein